MLPYFLNVRDGEKTLTVVLTSGQRSVRGACVDEVLEAIKNNDVDKVEELVDIASRIEKGSGGLFTAMNGNVYVDGKPVPSALADKLLEFYEQELPYLPLINFWKKLRNNPSERSVQCLYDFLEHNNVPLTEDGCFIAYKSVRSDFKDIHSGTIDNTPGLTVRVDRSAVDPDPAHKCSHGLHVAGWDYVDGTYYNWDSSYRYLELRVDPEHVVAVPGDYNFQKMRVCEYFVIREITEKPSNVDTIYVEEKHSHDVDDDSSDDWDDDSSDDWYDDDSSDDEDDDFVRNETEDDDLSDYDEYDDYNDEPEGFGD